MPDTRSSDFQVHTLSPCLLVGPLCCSVVLVSNQANLLCCWGLPLMYYCVITRQVVPFDAARGSAMSESYVVAARAASAQPAFHTDIIMAPDLHTIFSPTAAVLVEFYQCTDPAAGSTVLAAPTLYHVHTWNPTRQGLLGHVLLPLSVANRTTLLAASGEVHWTPVLHGALTNHSQHPPHLQMSLTLLEKLPMVSLPSAMAGVAAVNHLTERSTKPDSSMPLDPPQALIPCPGNLGGSNAVLEMPADVAVFDDQPLQLDAIDIQRFATEMEQKQV